ncbi:MAG: NlpC/P60 family protein [Aliishimia sp.]
MTTDRRSLFANSAIAHNDLRGVIEAERFGDGTLARISAPVADLRINPDKPMLDRQVLYGHPVRLLDPKTGFCRDETSGYVGYIDPNNLAPWVEPTHRVIARSTLLFDQPDFKRPDPIILPCGALLPITETSGKYATTSDALFALAAHLLPMDDVQPDLAATAANLVGTPYLWGGNSATGIDCSGLVQLAMQTAGMFCPGDSDQQRDQLGTTLPPDTTAKRNDLMFWKGHVALVYDSDTLLHANAYHMAVAFEPIQEACARIEAQGDGGLLAHKRL